MKTTISQQDDNWIARLDGMLDTAASEQTAKDLQPLFDCTDSNIILDCASLSYIASSGLRIFLSLLKKSKANGCKLVIKNISPDIRRVFTATGFIKLFDIQ